MKKKVVLGFFCCLLSLVSLTGCAKQSDLQGTWYAYSYQEADELTITIDKNTINFLADDGTIVTSTNFKVTRTGFENNVSYLVATIDGQPTKISFVFLDKNNKEEMFIFLLTNEDNPTSGIPQYKLSKTGKPDPNDGLVWSN